MTKKCTPLLLIFFICIGMTGCTTVTPLLKPADQPSSDSGYLYGRFNLAQAPQSCGLGVGLVLLHPDGKKEKEYLVRFARIEDDNAKIDDVIGVAVEPGDYVIDSSAFLMEGGSEYSRKPFDHLKKTFTVAKGNAYYVGEYFAKAECVAKSSQSSAYSWAMKEVVNNFGKTTTDFTNKYIHFKNITTISIIGN